MGVEITGPCRLCGQNAVLQNSHILPASAHRNTKQNGRNVLLASGNGIFKRNNQTDFTDLLLCFPCEQEFSKFERVAIEACRVAWRERGAATYVVPAGAVAALIAFAYSVFWRASISSRLGLYKLPSTVEERLRLALSAGNLPLPPELAISVSFLKVLDLPLTDRTQMAPWKDRLTAGLEVHYFSVFGIIFRMNFPYALHEIETDEFFRSDILTGRIFPLKKWEEEMIDNRFTYEAIHAKFVERPST